MEAEEELNKQASTSQNNKQSSEYYTWSSVSGTETEDDDVVSQEGNWVPVLEEESTEDETTEDESDTCGEENEIKYVDLENIHSLL